MSRPEKRTLDFDRSRLSSLLASLFLATLLLKVPGLTLFPVASLVFAISLAPVIVPALRASRATSFLLWSTPVAVLTGACLALMVPHHLGAAGDLGEMVTVAAWLVSIPATVGLGLWASRQLGIVRSLRLLALGGLVGSVLVQPSLEWKGSVGIYATLFALAMMANSSVTRVRWILVGSAAFSAISDARFLTLIALIVLLCTFSGSRVSLWIKDHPVRAILAIGGGLTAMVWAAMIAMQSGLLGSAIQARTLHQMTGGRSLIEAGRTEWAATIHLFLMNPFGFGTGVQVHQGLAADAVGAVKAVGGDWSANYFRVLVFGDRVDLHSVTADLWYHFGAGGVIFAVACAVLLTVSLPQMMSSVGGVGAAALFSVLVAAWDLLFSPMANSDRLIAGLLVAAIFVVSREGPEELRTNGRRSSAPAKPPSLTRGYDA